MDTNQIIGISLAVGLIVFALVQFLLGRKKAEKFDQIETERTELIKALAKSKPAEEDESAKEKRAKSLKFTSNIHFRLVDFTLINMSDEERIAYLEKVGKEQEARDKALREAGRRSPAEYWKLKAEQDGPMDPFPEWLSNSFRQIAARYGHEIVYDMANRGYVVSVYGEMKDIDTFVNAVDAEYTRLAQSNEEYGQFKLSHRLEPKIFIDDEHEVMTEYKRALAEASGSGPQAVAN